MLNAADAMKFKGTIDIVTEYDIQNAKCIISVQDNGPGIPVEKHERVFDPFYTTKQVGEGTGLGLFIVASIVEEHGGHIRIEDTVDKGVRFVITLPINSTGAFHGSKADDE